MTVELKDLHNKLILLCGDFGLAYDLSIQPVKVGPDCYYFYATRLDPTCRKLGFCKEEKFYALTGGERIEILDGNRQRLIKAPKGA